MNERNWIHPSKKLVKCIGYKAQDKKHVESLHKQTTGITFNFQLPQLLSFSLPSEEIFSGTPPKSHCGNSLNCQFLFLSEMPLPKPLRMQLRVFLLYFGFLPLQENFEHHCLKAIQIFQCFSSHNQKKIWQMTLDWEWWRLYLSFISKTEWCERRVMCQQLIGNIKHTWKTTYFFTSVVTAFLRAWNPCITLQFGWWKNLYLFTEFGQAGKKNTWLSVRMHTPHCHLSKHHGFKANYFALQIPVSQ